MSQYVHKSLIWFIIMGLEKFAPELAKEQAWAKQLLASENELLPLDVKKKLLNNVLIEGGPQLVMDLSSNYENPPPSPIIYIFLNSSSPLSLVQKIEQYDHYLHSNNRLQVEKSSDNSILLNHISLDRQPISPGEEFFMCGALIALFTKIGCNNVKLTWQRIGNPELQHYLDHNTGQQAANGASSAWSFKWESFSPQQQVFGLDNFLSSLSEPIDIAVSNSFSYKVEALLRQDLSYKLTLRDIAEKLAVSPRTLQRVLQKENNSFVKILQQVRISISTKLLIETEFSLSEIGFSTGFSDYAHFCREFKKIKGQTPFSFRGMHKNCSVQLS